MDQDLLIARLMSANTQEREEAWDSLLRTLVPRVERRVTDRLRHAPEFVRQQMEDIATGVMAKLVEKLGIGVPVMSVERFALGIADKLCLQALDVSRDRERGRGGEPADTAGSADPIAQKSGNELTGSRTVLATSVRGAVRPGLIDFRVRLEKDAREPRTGGAASSPVLQFHAVDLVMQGLVAPKDLKEATGISAVDATRARDRAIKALSACVEPHLRPEAAVSSTAVFELGWDQLRPGELMPSLWKQLSIGCVELDTPFKDAHHDHYAMLRAFHESHRSQCRDCGSPFEEPSAATLQTWKDAAERSLTHSGLI